MWSSVVLCSRQNQILNHKKKYQEIGLATVYTCSLLHLNQISMEINHVLDCIYRSMKNMSGREYAV